MRYGAERHWFNSEINAFNDSRAERRLGQVDRDRFFVDHDRSLIGNNTDLIWNSNIAGMENRFVATLRGRATCISTSVQDDALPGDYVDLVNPDRGLYGCSADREHSARTSTTSRCRSRTG